MDKKKTQELINYLKTEKRVPVRCNIAWDERTPKEVLDLLARDESLHVRGTVARNPRAPEKTLRYLFSLDDNVIYGYMDSNPSCPDDLLDSLASYDNPHVRQGVAENPNTSVITLEHMMDVEFSLEDKGLSWPYHKQNIIDACKENINKRVEELKNLLDLYETSNNKDTLPYIYKEITKFFGKRRTEEENWFDINIIKDAPFKKVDIGDKSKVKVGFKYNDERYLRENDIRSFSYGRYPQFELKKKTSKILNRLLNLGLLKKTGIQYRIPNGLRNICYLNEYEINGHRFVNFKNRWIVVKPIKWIYDKEKRMFVSENLLLKKSSIRNSDWVLSTLFEEDVYATMADNKILSKFRDVERDKIKQNKEEEYKNKVQKSLDKKVNAEEQRNIKRKQLVAKLLKCLNDVKEINEAIGILDSASQGLVSVKRVYINPELLIKEVDGHFEINEEFIPFLKYIDLTGLGENLKVSNLNWKQTNAHFDPQEVFNKDLSNSKFDDENFVFKNFSGCNLCGTDLGEERDCYGFENAIVDERTILPTILNENKKR